MIQANDIARDFDREPPCDVDAEKCVIASMMLDAEVRGECLALLKPNDFFSADNSTIFTVLASLDEQEKKVDGVLLRGTLEDRGILSEVGGTAYLGECLGAVPSAAHGVEYARRVRDKSTLRRLIAAHNDGLRDVYARGANAAELVERAEQRVFALAERGTASEPESIETIMHEVFEQIEQRGQRGIETGYFELDDMLNGLQNGELIIVAARPSVGKTALAMNIVENVSAGQSIPSAIFSLEMSKQQLAQRMLCGRARVDSHKLRKGMLQAHEYTVLAKIVAEMAVAPIWVEDSPGISPLTIRAMSRRLKRQHDIKLVVIDYLQLIEVSRRSDSRQQDVSDISRSLKAMARELNVPVIALSQLNRDIEKRTGGRPRMSDLRESGSLEQDADVVLLLHREDYGRMDEENYQPTNVAEVIIAKQRNGPTGTVKLTFNNKSTRFENLSTQGDPF